MYQTLFKAPRKIYLIVFFLLILSTQCYKSLHKSIYPQMTRPKIEVSLPFDNYSREYFINTYGKALEQDLSNLSTNVTSKYVEASYSDYRARYFVNFDWSDSPNKAREEVERLINSYKSNWPQALNKNIAVINKSNTSSDFFIFTFSSDRYDQESLIAVLKSNLYPYIQGLSSISDVYLPNLSQNKITLTFNPYLITQYNIDLSDLYNYLYQRDNSSNITNIKIDDKDLHFEFDAEQSTIEAIKKYKIRTKDGNYIELQRFTDIEKKTIVGQELYFKVNTLPAVIGQIKAQEGYDLYSAVKEASEVIEKMLASDPLLKYVQFSPLIDPSKIIDESLTHVIYEIFLCATIAVLVLFVFIRDVISVATVIVEIPLSLFLSCIVFYLFDIHLNLISLGGLALSIGMNVDASIVVIDAINHEIKKLPPQPKNSQLLHAISSAIKTVALPLTLATICSIIVFIPLTFTSKITLAIMGDMAMAVIISHTLSLLVSLVLVPIIRYNLFSFFPASVRTEEKNNNDNHLIKLYKSSLNLIMNSQRVKFISISLIFALMTFSFLMMKGTFDKEIISDPKGKYLLAFISPTKNNVTKDQTENFLDEITNYLIHDKKLATMGLEQFSGDRGAMGVFMLTSSLDFSKVEEELKELEKDQNNFKINVSNYSPTKIPLPQHYDWKVKVQSKDYGKLESFEDFLYYELLDHNDMEITQTSKHHGQQHDLQVLTFKEQIDNHPANRVNKDQIKNHTKQLLRLLVEDKYLGQKEDGNRVTYIHHHSFFGDNFSQPLLLGLPFKIDEQYYPLRSLFDIESNKTTNHIWRIDGDNTLIIQGTTDNSSIEKEKVLEQSIEKARSLTNDFETRVEIKYEDSQVADSLHQLYSSIILSIVIIALVLYMRFSSLTITTIILLAIPFAILGVLLGLYFTKTKLCLNALLGIILLNGLAVSNSILIVEQYLEFLKQGQDNNNAIINAINIRLRPILMTSMTTVLGMLPVAIGIGENAEVLQPLGIAVSCGLWVSLIFTLYLVPVALQVFNPKINHGPNT